MTTRYPPKPAAGDNDAEPVANEAFAVEQGVGSLVAAPTPTRPLYPNEPDLYALLGVAPHASDDAIRYAYRSRAGRLLDRRWRPGRAARQLADLNAAYEILGNPDRRADYDLRRNGRQLALSGATFDDDQSPEPLPLLPRHVGARPRLRGPSGLLEVTAILAVIALALYAATAVVNTRGLVDLSWILDTGESLGLPVRRKATAVVPTVPPRVAPTAEPRPTPAEVAAAPTVAPAPARPTARDRSQGSTASISDEGPVRRSNVTITARFLRDGQPIPGAPVYAVAHYRTIDERWPASGDLSTDVNGEVRITSNVGDATAGHPVGVDVIATVEGEPIARQVSFVPR